MSMRYLPLVLAACLFSTAALAFGPVPLAVPANDRFAAAGYLDVTHYGAKGDGKTDSTAALRRALDDGYNSGMAVMLPPGTYLVSDTLRREQNYQQSGCGEQLNFGAPKTIIKAPMLVGQPGASRPVIRLKDGATGFNSTASPKPVVYFINNNPNYTDWQGHAACAMGLVVRGIEINLGLNNPGAVGISMPSAQYSTIEDVKVVATGAYAGIRGTPSTNVVVNVEVEGGQYGIIPATCCGISLVGIKLRNQTTAGLLLNNWGASMVTGFDIQTQAPGAVPILNTQYRSQTSEVALLDGVIVAGGGGNVPAISNPEGHSLWAGNVYVITSGRPIVKSAGNPAVAGGATQRIDEYSYTNSVAHNEAGLTHLSYTLINGATSQNEIVRVNPGTAPPDLVERHLFGSIPWFADADVLDATTLGAIGDGVTDSTAAIQSAIDQSNDVFLPRGDYLISGTLTFRPNTRLFGVSGMRSRLFGEKWNPAGQFVPFIRTPDAATARPYLGDIWIHLPPTQAKSFIGGLDWQSGRNSIVRQVAVTAQWEFCAEGTPDSTCYASAARKLVHIRGNGGGRWYGLQLLQKGGRMYNAGFRGLYIDGTHEPLTLYGPNPEHQLIAPFLEINGASDVRILGTKSENLTYAIVNSRNVMYAAHTGNSDYYPMMKVAGSTNVVLPVFSEYAKQGSSQAGRVIDPALPYIVYDATHNVGISGDDRVSLFKLGSYDPEPFEPDSGPQGPIACRAASAVTIDGNAADWMGVSSNLIPYTRTVSGSPPTSDADSSAAFRVKWDGSRLYVLVEVRDDAVTGTASAVYVNDGAELYLDGGHERAASYDTNDYQLTVDWRGTIGGVRSNQVAFTRAVLRTTQGYNVEYSIPWSALATPSAGTVIGIDVGVNDDDGGDGARDSQIVWHGDGTGWSNPAQFGEIALSATACP